MIKPQFCVTQGSAPKNPPSTIKISKNLHHDELTPLWQRRVEGVYDQIFHNELKIDYNAICYLSVLSFLVCGNEPTTTKCSEIISS